MEKILSFDHDRELGFSSERELWFDPNDGLAFDSGRDLAFDHTRDLPFGKKGVVFRGYVCPECGAVVLMDQSRCYECGVKFAGKKPPKKKRASKKRSRGKPRRKELGYCMHCGVVLSMKDVYCWNCGNVNPLDKVSDQTSAQGERIHLPRKRVTPKVTKDWSETGYRKPEE